MSERKANCARTLPFYCRDFTRGVPTVTSPGPAVQDEEIDMDVDDVDVDAPTAAEQLNANIALERQGGTTRTAPRAMEKVDPHPEAEPTPQDIVNGTRKRRLSEFDVGSWRPALPSTSEESTSTASTSDAAEPSKDSSEPSSSGGEPPAKK